MKKRFFNFIVILLILPLFNWAQLPINDGTWNLSQQDDFNSPSLSPQWNTAYPWGAPVNNGEEYNYGSNLLLNYNSGYLSIKCETMTPLYYAPKNKTYYYKGAVATSSFTTKYGYFEISAKMPIGVGYWPAFWLFGAYGCEWYNEIDIAENGGLQNNYADEMGHNYIWALNSTTCTSCTTCVMNGMPTASTVVKVPGNTSNEHKYAMFWEPGKITWFFDDLPVHIVEDPIYVPTHAINTIINFALDYNIYSSTATFPAYFELNYMKIWQLIPADLSCPLTTTENICNFNAGTYNYKVKKSIIIGGSSCSSNINTSDNVNLWATDFVLLDEGTTLNANGSGACSINTTPCPN